MINTSSLKPNDLCWIWISSDETEESETDIVKIKALFNGNTFTSKDNNPLTSKVSGVAVWDGQIFGSSVYKFKKINKP